jgi:hypothetical protein
VVQKAGFAEITRFLNSKPNFSDVGFCFTPPNLQLDLDLRMSKTILKWANEYIGGPETGFFEKTRFLNSSKKILKWAN